MGNQGLIWSAVNRRGRAERAVLTSLYGRLPAPRAQRTESGAISHLRLAAALRHWRYGSSSEEPARDRARQARGSQGWPRARGKAESGPPTSDRAAGGARPLARRAGQLSARRPSDAVRSTTLRTERA